MLEKENDFFEFLDYLLHTTELSESFLDRVKVHFERLSKEQEKEAIRFFKESTQNSLIQLLNIGRPSFVSNLEKTPAVNASIDLGLNHLELSYCNTLPDVKRVLFEKWLSHVHEMGSRGIGKQRLDLFLSLFEKKTVAELDKELTFRINIGHTGLFLNPSTTIIVSEEKSESSDDRNDFFKRVAEENERIGRELSNEKTRNNDKKLNGGIF